MDDDLLRAVGERALLVASASPAGFAQQIRAAAARDDVDVQEVVPGARTVLVEVGRAVDVQSLRALLSRLVENPTAQPDGGDVSIPVRFDGEDLGWASDAVGLAADELIELVAATTLTAAFCGFAPGFAYLTGLPSRLALARRDRPRTKVPAGSFAVAGEYAAIYPGASPGGWRLLGHTELVMFDPAREPAALIAPGARVHIVPVD